MGATSAARPTGQAPAAEPPRRGPAPAHGRSDDQNQLIVGRGVTVSGKIVSCDQLIVEGTVEADLTDCREVDITEGGLFKGSAVIEEAEFAGRFEGSLTVQNRLLIKASGSATGTIRYGQIEIERGGQISGDIQTAEAWFEPTDASAVN